METNNHDKKIGVFAYELIGTSLIMFGVMVTIMTYDPILTAVMMLVAWNVSGGHFNPAITVGVYVSQMKFGKQAVTCLLMIVAQFLGALLGILWGYLVLLDNDWADISA